MVQQVEQTSRSQAWATQMKGNVTGLLSRRDVRYYAGAATLGVVLGALVNSAVKPADPVPQGWTVGYGPAGLIALAALTVLAGGAHKTGKVDFSRQGLEANLAAAKHTVAFGLNSASNKISGLNLSSFRRSEYKPVDSSDTAAQSEKPTEPSESTGSSWFPSFLSASKK